MIYIPTYKRLDRQPTATALSNAGVPCTLVVRPEEAHEALGVALTISLGGNAPVAVLSLPTGISNIGETRQFIVEEANKHDEHVCIMMDDDLVFAVRGKREDNPLYLSPANDEDIGNMIDWMYDQLTGDYALAGISAREGNNRKEESTEVCTRMMRAWGLHLPTFFKTGASFKNMSCMEDFDVILTFLTNGYPNIVSNNWTTNQSGSNTSGGCSTYRTLEVQAEAAKALAAKYPGIVKAVEKETKTAWGGGKRTDVVIYWKKAFKQGQDFNHAKLI